MPQYLIDTLIKRDSGSEIAIDVHFDYFIPSHYIEWQDKS